MIPLAIVNAAAFNRPIAVIGDIHGCAATLARLLDALGDRPLVFVGDLVDRGPSSRQVVETLIQRQAVGVRGNHDEWLITWLGGGGFDDGALSRLMGGRATLASYGITGTKVREIEVQAYRVPASHAAFLTNLPLALDLTVMGQEYWLVHAGVMPGAPRELDPSQVVPWLAANKPLTLLWPSTPPANVVALDRTVIMGHCVLDTPVDLGHVIALDTGCGVRPDGKLSAVLLPERWFVSVEMAEEDQSPR